MEILKWSTLNLSDQLDTIIRGDALLGGLQNMKIEEHPLKNEILEQVFLGKLDIMSAAKRMGVPYETLWNYVKRTKEKPKQVETVTDVIEIMRDLLKKVRSRVSEMLAMPVEVRTERDVASSIQALRGIVMDLAQLERQISTAPVVQIETLNIQYNKLQEFIVASLCDDCKEKVIQFLESEEK